MSSSYRLKRRIESNSFNFGSDPSTHYLRPFGECYPGDSYIPIGNEDGVKVCFRKQVPSKTKKANKEEATVNTSYNLYHKDRVKQERPFNPWPGNTWFDEGGKEWTLEDDYIKIPIRYDPIGFGSSYIKQDHPVYYYEGKEFWNPLDKAWNERNFHLHPRSRYKKKETRKVGTRSLF